MTVAETVKVFPVIGLEVHAQLATKSKMFCPCPTTFAAEANSATCPVCLGFPGTLPVVNREAITLALRLGLALGCEIDARSTFARKNYFYPDLPKGYQITQYDRPLCSGGSVEIDTADGPRSIGLVRIHLEEDAGKSLHDTPYADVPPSLTLVEWNRAGVPLVEIVSKPEIRSSTEAMSYLTELRKLLRALLVSDANMEEGNMRCDANISIRASEDAPFGTRAEIKNMNSIRNVGRAIEHEISRQADVIARGGRVVQETRLFDAATGATRTMRSKEEAHDYRYFPEPDLGVLAVSKEWIAEVAAKLPELPRARRARYRSEFGLSEADAELLSSARALGDYFEALAARVPARAAATWTAGEILRWMKEARLSPEEAGRFAVTPEAAAPLLQMVDRGSLSSAAAKVVLEEMVRTGRAAGEIVAEKNLGQVSDETTLRAVIEKILSENPRQVDIYRSGKTATFGWFVGSAMKATGGNADPAVVNRLLHEMLKA